ncbi:MAG: T9SS type A sorting domain-containing protein [Bacteroidota bacterium]
MKIRTFIILFLLIAQSVAWSQTYNSGCIPQPHADPENNSEMEPDNIAASTFSSVYYQKIDILPPPSASGYEVQWIKLRQINNLPSGLSWATNTEQLNSGTWYCCEVTGTPNGQVGLFHCEIIVDARVKVLFVWTTQTNQSGGFIIAEVLPAKFVVSGGGSLCATPAGFPIQVSGSNSGATYELFRNGTPTGTTMSGTGSALTFPSQNIAGAYTVIAKADYDFDATDTNYITPQAMTGSAIITANYPNVNLGNNQTIYLSGSHTFDAGTGFESYLWNINADTTQDLTLTGATLGVGSHQIIVTVSNNQQCFNSDTAILTVNPNLSIDAEILSFEIPNQIGNSVINSANGTIEILMPNAVALNNLIPQITISGGALINYTQGTPQSFVNSVNYVVTAENGQTTKTWIASVSTDASIKLNSDDVKLFYDNVQKQIIVKCSNIQFKAQLLNINGTLIDEFMIDCNQEKHIDNISKGVYFVKLQNDKITKTLKFVL